VFVTLSVLGHSAHDKRNVISPKAVIWQLRLAAWIPGLVAIAVAGPARAEVSVKPPFASSMVLQREMAVPIWGTASGGEQVSVTVASQTKTVTAPANGKWSLKLDPMPAGGPYVVTIKGTNTVELEDVYVGEVWQAAGQSNMDTRLN
jgi:sialate O-acetylesterase